ncbi:lipid-A-disaccharide synthase N-terminal domain-containing protein [Paenibacillus sp. JDR-2]|uniref:lipid-A-disaccharide synthase N-terminal domain-containing protein n=1 Tax=Paenibacillus sp. (strain JDR-2) TaxID=324057 RepID=UPI000166499E|nr:lipid-A-disaccharide synthase N-terminal domain-containing protein [Paenibacillus sp. JDR-2]ACT04097.1 lipid A biosynthesis domain protein [Paenibacillus sp. JDR-2]
MWWHSIIGNVSAGNMGWIIFGFIGQIMFTMRFITQWLASEKAKKTVIPLSFWVYSILGSAVLSIYAIYRKDPVFLLGQLPSVFIYFRNIMLTRKSEVQTSNSNSVDM